MNSSKLRVAVASFLVLAMNTLVSCAHKEAADMADTEKEVWELKITGMAQGGCDMFVWQSKKEKGLYYVVAEFEAVIEQDSFGGGEVKCKIEGTLRDDRLSAKLHGFARMEEYDEIGPVSVSGEAGGRFSESEASGTWYTAHDYGRLKGHWTARKIR